MDEIRRNLTYESEIKILSNGYFHQIIHEVCEMFAWLC